MIRPTSPGVLLASVLVLLCACARPVTDPAKLVAIRNEALSLAKSHPAPVNQGWAAIPKNQWPPTIASLAPKIVTVDDTGVDILIQHGFDGGYGYEIPRDGRSLAMPAKCYSEPAKGLFWHDPC